MASSLETFILLLLPWLHQVLYWAGRMFFSKVDITDLNRWVYQLLAASDVYVYKLVKRYIFDE